MLNGWELGSGSIRIHEPELQQRIFDAARHRRGGGRSSASASSSTRSATARRRTAGFAFGIDRLVAILAGEENIREVIAFPKTQSGADPLTGAPDARSTRRQLAELGLASSAAQVADAAGAGVR